MATFLIVIGCLIALYIVLRISLLIRSKKIGRSMLDQMERTNETPEMFEKSKDFDERFKRLKELSFESDFELLYHLSAIHVMNMLSKDSEWSSNISDFRIKKIKKKEIKTRLRFTHLTGDERIYQVNYKLGKLSLMDANNYEVGSKQLDILNNPLDDFY